MQRALLLATASLSGGRSLYLDEPGPAENAKGTAVAAPSVTSSVRSAGQSTRQRTTRVVSGGSLIGLAFDPNGGFVLASCDTVFRFAQSPAARRDA